MTEAQQDTGYAIEAWKWGFFLEKFEKLSKKAVKIHGKPLRAEITETFEKKVGKDAYNRPVFETFYRFKLDAEPVRISGHTFVATVDHVNDAGNLIGAVPNTGIEIPEHYRTAKPFCQHCNSLRMRRNTFLLREDKTGELKQIGKNCLADFIGREPTRIVAWAQMLGTITGMSEDDFDGAYGMADRRTIDLLTYLMHTAVQIRIYGWVSRAMAMKSEDLRSTADRAMTNMFPPKNIKTGKADKTDPILDQDRDLANAALEWAKTLVEKRNKNDYEHNLTVIAQEQYIEYKSTGLAASIVSGYLRHMERLKVERTRQSLDLTKSQYVGELKKRIDFGKVRVLSAYSGPSGDWFVHRYTFVTPEGNVLTWSASSSQNLLKGSEVMLVGTVKGYDEYKDVKRTKITRCVVKEVEAA